MVKFRLFFNTDKETEWLNEMSRKGYAMTGYAAGFYSFDMCQPGEYVYQIDFTEGLFSVTNDYREFMKEAGVEIVCLWGMWVILRRKAAEGDFVLYTDVESTIAYYAKIKRMFKVAMIIECACLLTELFAVMAGNGIAIVFSSLLMALIIGLKREVMRVSDILDDLKGRIGQETGRIRKRRPSIFIPVGLLMNAMACAMPVWAVGSQGFLYGFLKGLCHGLAIIFMVIGLVSTLRHRVG